jgi:hypothetical protein
MPTQVPPSQYYNYPNGGEYGINGVADLLGCRWNESYDSPPY